MEDGNGGQALGVAAHSVASLLAIVDGATRKRSKPDTPGEGFKLGDFQLRLAWELAGDATLAFRVIRTCP